MTWRRTRKTVLKCNDMNIQENNFHVLERAMTQFFSLRFTHIKKRLIFYLFFCSIKKSSDKWTLAIKINDSTFYLNENINFVDYGSRLTFLNESHGTDFSFTIRLTLFGWECHSKILGFVLFYICHWMT